MGRHERADVRPCRDSHPPGVVSVLVKITEKIKSLLRRKPPTDEELAARAEAERERDEARIAAIPGRGGRGGWDPGN
jgi:hypothetical protein